MGASSLCQSGGLSTGCQARPAGWRWTSPGIARIDSFLRIFYVAAALHEYG